MAVKMLPKNKIVVRGAKENNLKDLSVEIPRDALVVMTGVSGSGKSSLAFDTIYAEGQRRYMESLSSYARMFLGQMEKPDVESIEGLSPAISIDQKSTNKKKWNSYNQYSAHNTKNTGRYLIYHIRCFINNKINK